MPRLRPNLYANVVSTLALTVALGGVSYAAVTITGKDIKNGSVTSKDLARNSVKSEEVANGSLKAKDFQAGQLPQGPAGPAGPAGPQGPSTGYAAANPGPTSITQSTAVVTLPLPAGSYVLTAKATISSAFTSAVLTRCQLLAGPSSDVARASLTGNGVDGGRVQTLPMTLTHTFASPGSAVLQCENFGAPGQSENARITAVQVASIAP